MRTARFPTVRVLAQRYLYQAAGSSSEQVSSGFQWRALDVTNMGTRQGGTLLTTYCIKRDKFFKLGKTHTGDFHCNISAQVLPSKIAVK